MPLLCLPICSVLARDCLKEGGYIPCHFTILCNALHSLRRVGKKTGGGGGSLARQTLTHAGWQDYGGGGGGRGLQKRRITYTISPL